MTVQARPVVVRPQSTVEPGHTEGHRPEDLDDEPDDIGLHADHADDADDADDAAADGEHFEEVSADELDAEDAEEPEVEDTPADDATIAAARIERFDEAHRGVAPVDAGPFEERNRD